MSPNINFKGANASFSIIIQIHDISKASKGVMELRGYIFQKLLLAWKISCIFKNCIFVKETDTFGHIVV